MDIAIVIALSGVLVLATTVLHYEILHGASVTVPHLVKLSPRRRTLLTIFAALTGHCIEIAFYAVGYWIAEAAFGLGGLSGTLEGDAVDYIYFAAATFTTLGVGDIVVDGPLRLMAGVTSLHGLVLIAWSASFTYLTMEKVWADGTGNAD